MEIVLKTLQVPLENITIVEDLKTREGSFGSVVVGKWKERDVAIKRITCHSSQLNDGYSYRDIENEVLVMNVLSSEIAPHPNILLCYGFAKDEALGQMNLIMELAPYGSFGSVVQDTVHFGRFPPLMCLAWGMDMIEVVAYLHSKGMKHCDVKPDNFLLFDHLRLKFCSFGYAKKHRLQSLTLNSANAMGYLDPVNGSSPASDIFSWCMSMVHVFTRRPPNTAQTPIQRVEEIGSCIDSDGMKYGFGEFLQCLSACCDADVDNRLTSTDILRRMKNLVEENGQDPRTVSNHALSGWITAMENKLRGPVSSLNTISLEPCVFSFSPSSKLHNLKEFENNHASVLRDKQELGKEHDEVLMEDQALHDRVIYEKILLSLNVESILKWESDHSIKFDNQSLKEGVNLWCNNKTLAEKIYGVIGAWDTSEVTSMQELFAKRDKFNEDISRWNVSNVTNMAQMFCAASSFNQSLSKWNVTNVTNMAQMFSSATLFNHSLSSWNVSNVTYMVSMFQGASSFNQSLSTWNVSNVTNMAYMFSGASSFNQPLISWNVSNSTNMFAMFAGASSFNQSLSSWNVSNVSNMHNMFSGAVSFNQPLSSWNVFNVTDMAGMFYCAKSFNQSLSNWNVSNVTNMFNMFYGASSFNIAINAPWYHK